MDDKVGAVIVGRIGRMSIRKFASNAARTIPGLAHMRSNVAIWRTERFDGDIHLTVAPLPHAERTARPNSCNWTSWFVDGV